jgi:error-prone DNA polymerase
MTFVHLHTHSTFSFGDGACRIPELVARAAELGMPALAVTDHEGLYGAVRFYQACKAAGVKPIVGVELTVEAAVGPGGRPWQPDAHRSSGRPRAAMRTTPAARGAEGVQGGEGGQQSGYAAPFAALPSLAPDGHIRHLAAAATVPPAAAAASGAGGHHLVLLAKDYAGWSNLCRIISAAHLEHPGEPPLARLATLAEHSGHLVALSACRRGEVWSRLLAGDAAGARAAASVFRGIFRHEFFIELQHELLPGSGADLRALDLLAHELRLPTVATNDVHYTVKEDAGLHDVLAAEAANQPLPNPLGRKNAELYLKSPGQMQRLFQRHPEAYANAGRIAARCNLDLGLGRLLFPAYPLPPGETAFSLLWKRCFAGAAERYTPLTAEVTARLERELKVVEELGFAEYFLAVHDIVEFARGRGIYYSGRGSAGNSIVSYVLRVTDADPIANELLFERFLNPARREMPDVDIDFCSARRDEVIQYIYERFGHDNVAMVATVNTVRAPSAVRIVSRAFGFTPEEINALSKRVPWGSASKLGEMLDERPELADHEFRHPHFRRLVSVAERLSGFPAHLGTHLGGFILSRDPLTDRVPLQWAAKGVVVAQFDKDDVETLGLVKMDILALKMHSAIAEAVRRIEARTGEHVSAWELPRDDPKVYELIRSARTVGLFQLESSGQRNLATRLQERDFEDVIAAISLFRPGPLQADMIAPFIRRRHGREPVAVPHPAMERVLRRTYGVIVYQEQVIEVAAAVAGFSLSEGDMLRRAMTHERSLEEMDEIGRTFVEKAVARGVAQEVAEEVFRQLRGFAAYGFNKAHAACFAIVCNASAWLKAHYPAEFYAGVLNNQPMGFYSPRVVLNDARRFGIKVLPLDVNRSGEWFEVERDGTALRVGLAYVKEMSAAARRAIVEARGDGGAAAEVADGGEGGSGGRSAPYGSGYADPSEPPSPPSPPFATSAPGGLFGARTSPLVDAAGERAGPPRGGPQRAAGPAADDGPPRPYTSLTDFIARTGVSREIAENLVRLGAFDALGVRREELVAQVPLLYAGAKPAGAPSSRPARGAERPAEIPARPTVPGFDHDGDGLDQPRLALDEQLAPLTFLPDWPRQRRVSIELELLGLNVSAHPLRFVREQVKALGVTSVARLPQVPHGRRVRLAGVLERAQMPWIRSGHRTMFLTIEDETELGQVVVFNDVYLKYGRVLKSAVYLLVEGELQNDEDHGLAVVAHRIMDLTEVLGRGGVLPGGRRHEPAAGAEGVAGPQGGAWPPATAGPGAGTPGFPGGLTSRRPDAWELPSVEPRTRPGRTG